MKLEVEGRRKVARLFRESGESLYSIQSHLKMPDRSICGRPLQKRQLVPAVINQISQEKTKENLEDFNNLREEERSVKLQQQGRFYNHRLSGENNITKRI